MPKFTVMVTEVVERTKQYTVNVSKAAVIKSEGLEGEDKTDWKEHVQSHLERSWDEYSDKADHGDVLDETISRVDINDVEDAD